MSKIVKFLKAHGPSVALDIRAGCIMTGPTVYRELARLHDEKRIEPIGEVRCLDGPAGRTAKVWAIWGTPKLPGGINERPKPLTSVERAIAAQPALARVWNQLETA